MPNYRSILSQLSYIHDEDLVILQSNHRIRTINFAARHFFLIFMAVMPLQWSSILDSDHHKLINVIFHGSTDHLGKYSMFDNTTLRQIVNAHMYVKKLHNTPRLPYTDNPTNYKRRNRKNV